jgi:hypothetical protein
MMRRIEPILLILLLACSGGGGGGSSVAGGGIGGTGISSGPITGIGSFFVTGTEWSVGPGGEVLLDGESFSESDLALGMVVTVEGTRAGDGTGTATRVVFDDDVEGPLDVALGTYVLGLDETLFRVFGQSFVADRNTAYANTTFSDFQSFFDTGVAAVVEVSGLPDVRTSGDPVIRATRIEVKVPNGPVAGVTEVELEGEVHSLAGNQFMIGPVTVRFNDLPGCVTDLTDVGGSVSEGDRIEVEGVFFGDDEVCAEVIEREDAFPDIGEFEIEGIVTQVTSSTSFTLSDIPVDAVGARFEPANLQVQEGMRLEVEGALTGGVLVAEEVQQRGEVEIEALVTDAFAGGFFVLGREIALDDATEVEDGPVASGNFVEVRAVDDGMGGLTATRVKVQPGSAADRVRVEGRVEAVPSSEPPRTLTIAGIAIRTDDGTDCRDAAEQPMDCSDFFAQVQVGDEVQATDTDGDYENFGRADELEFED